MDTEMQRLNGAAQSEENVPIKSKTHVAVQILQCFEESVDVSMTVTGFL